MQSCSRPASGMVDRNKLAPHRTRRARPGGRNLNLKIIEYAPEHFDLLQSAARQTAIRNLINRDFVNHYYASSPWCNLYLLLSNDKTVVGTIGIERMPFDYRGRKMSVAFATNYYSL